MKLEMLTNLTFHFTFKQMSIFLLRHSCHLHACLRQTIYIPCVPYKPPSFVVQIILNHSLSSYLNSKHNPNYPILIHFFGTFCRCDWWQVLGAHAHRKAGLVAREASVLWSTRLLHRRHRHRLQTQIQDRQCRQIRARLRRKPRRPVPWCVCQNAPKRSEIAQNMCKLTFLLCM